MALVPFPSATRGDDEGDDRDIDESGSKMSFLEHLDELRKRLIYIAYSLLLGCAVAYLFIQKIVDFILKPMQNMLPGGNKLIFTSGAEPFMLYLKIGFLAGIFFASPLILWQVWKFIAPGLYTHEKKFAIPFVLMSTIFFVTGGVFSHYMAFPWTWQFFISFSTDYMIFLPKIEDAFSLYSKMLLGFGLIFEMPTLVFFLARMGVVSAGFLLRYFKYAVLIIAIVAAVVSPGTDAMSMIVMAVPMLGLYLISIVIAWIFGKRKQPATD
ncbi:MAG TPA: twin-arginine translocase subunit TatC [Vicinamibacterales bacterium]